MNNLVPATLVRDRRPAPINPQAVRDRLRDLVAEVRARHRRAGEGELAARLVERLEDDPEALQLIARYVVRAMTEAEARRRRETTPGSRTRRQTEVRAQAKVLAVQARRQLLLDLPVMLLTGEVKALRYCLGRELASLGSAYGRLAAKVPADAMCGECLVEREVAELLSVPA